MEEKEREMTEVEKVNRCASFLIIKCCVETNSTKTTITQESTNGTYKIVITKIANQSSLDLK